LYEKSTSYSLQSRKQRTSLSFNSTACEHNSQAALLGYARLNHSTKPVVQEPVTCLIPVLLITASWQCYRSRSVNILCEML